MLSAGQHDDDIELSDGRSDIPDMTAVKLSGRLVSARDLMKWCSRVSAHLETSDTSLATKAFQVMQSFKKPALRISLNM